MRQGEERVTLRQTVFVVDDDTASRDSVMALAGSMGIEARAFESAEEFLAAYDGSQPGCLVTDLRMLGMTGVELLETLRERGVELPTIVLSGHADVPITVRAMQLGAVTLLEKPARSMELWDAIRQALERDQRRREQAGQLQEIQARLSTLTEQEQQVLDMIVAGLPNKAIANRLFVSLRTVESRRKSVFEKTKTRTVAELVRLVESVRSS
jgi:two-component system, LuxR family, response regulator FixJ